MKIRLLALGIAVAAHWSMARAESFLEVVNASAQRSTGMQTQGMAPGASYTVGSLRLNLDEGQRAFISYTYMGAESPDRHRFYGPDMASMIDSAAARGTQITTSIRAGLLDFSFAGVDATAAGLTSVLGNRAWNASSIGIVLDATGRSGWLLFEDGRGVRGPDLDYDDMVMKFDLHVAPVPEPGTTALMAAGLGALAVLRRRRRAGHPA